MLNSASIRAQKALYGLIRQFTVIKSANLFVNSLEICYIISCDSAISPEVSCCSRDVGRTVQAPVAAFWIN